MTSQIASLRRILPVVALLAAGACGTSAPPMEAAPLRPGATLAAEPFSAERAWAHLLALAELGPRPSGSPAAQEAFEYLRSRLEETPGLEVLELVLSEHDEAAAAAAEAGAAEGEAEAAPAGPDASGEEARPVRHLVARIAGASPDSFLLLAHYDTGPETPGANDGASGAAVLLELARQLAERPLHYTVEIVFLDDEMAPAGKPPATPGLRGSRLLAGRLERDGTLDAVRLVVALRQVGDADLAIGRDLLSDRIHRETFFEAAADLGLGDAFPTNRGFISLVASHQPFLEVGMRRVVGLMDPWYGGDEPPGTHWGGAADTPEQCAEDSLETVGVVTLAGLRRISERFEKIDRISGRAARRRAETLAPEDLAPAEALPEERPDPGADAAPAGSGAKPEEASEPEGSEPTPAEPPEMAPEAAPEAAPAPGAGKPDAAPAPESS